MGIKQEFDINYYHKYPLNVLCNFMPSNFTFESIKMTSMEGFLQSLKINHVALQKKICRLAAPHAKRVGSHLKRSGQFDGTHLYWLGNEYNRYSVQYQELLDKVYLEKFHADEDFRYMLLKTAEFQLVHKAGKTNEADTVLTEAEFIHHLVSLRSYQGNVTFENDESINRTNGSCEIDLKKIENTQISGLRAYNDKIVCGKEVLGKTQEENLKKTGVTAVLDLYHGRPGIKSCYKSTLLHYCFPINDPEPKMDEIESALPDFIKFLTIENSYIFCKKRLQEANTALAANYLFNPKSMLSEAVLWGQIEPDDILIKQMDELYQCLTEETKEQLGWGSDFENEYPKRKNLIREMNVSRNFQIIR
jgi:predicted NAD-dependent protein-ADP-ribosyltransferase YbiA (DUF1768 family)